jgi:GNAT superfamily N-acetyltransferase
VNHDERSASVSVTRSLRIRAGVQADAPELAIFAARTFEENFGSQNRPEDLRAHLKKAFGITQQTRELLDPDVVTLLAYDDARLVAFAQVKRQDPPHGIRIERPIELHRFYVDRPAHGKGVAQQLMLAVHNVARAFQGQNLWLGVWERNTRAIAFYRKAGFVDRGCHDFIVGSDRQTDRVLVAPVRQAGSNHVVHQGAAGDSTNQTRT